MPPRPCPRLISALDACEGVFTLHGLCANDVPGAAVEALMRNRQRSRRVLPGVYVAHTGPVNERQLDLSAMAYAGPTAVLTSARALALHGLREGPRTRERVVLLDAAEQRASRDFVTVLETYRLPTPVLLHGLAVAPPARAALDLARASIDQRLVQVVWSELLRTRKATVMELQQELDEGPRRGSALPRAVLAGLHTGARSKPELDALIKFTESARIPPPILNAHLYDAEGNWIACVDFYWKGLVAEMQSKLFHFALHAWESEEARKGRLASHGLLVAPIVPNRVYKDWLRLEDEVARAIEAAATNTCRVTVGPPPEWWGQRMG